MKYLAVEVDDDTLDVLIADLINRWPGVVDVKQVVLYGDKFSEVEYVS